jgi:hypothetical protein
VIREPLLNRSSGIPCLSAVVSASRADWGRFRLAIRRLVGYEAEKCHGDEMVMQARSVRRFSEWPKSAGNQRSPAKNGIFFLPAALWCPFPFVDYEKRRAGIVLVDTAIGVSLSRLCRRLKSCMSQFSLPF